VGRVLVDSNVLLDVLTDDPVWGEWSAGVLSEVGDESVLVINPIIYAEVSVGFHRIEELDEALSPEWIQREPLPWEAAFLAGKCFLRYRRHKRSPLPDFYIGAHAAVGGMTLVTRDPRRYLTYFPGLSVLSP